MRYVILALIIVAIPMNGSELDGDPIKRGEERLSQIPYKIVYWERKIDGNEEVQRVSVDEDLLYTETYKSNELDSIYVQFGGCSVGAFGINNDGNTFYVQYMSPYEATISFKGDQKWPFRIEVRTRPKAGPFEPPLAIIEWTNGKYRPLEKVEIISETKLMYKLSNEYE